jgi:hypothetical protein
MCPGWCCDGRLGAYQTYDVPLRNSNDMLFWARILLMSTDDYGSGMNGQNAPHCRDVHSWGRRAGAAKRRVWHVAAMPAIAERRKPAKKPIDPISICANNASELRRAYSRGLPGQNPLQTQFA